MTAPDRWDEAVIAREIGSAAISESRNDGWEWRATPAGSDEPKLLVGRRTTHADHDVVRIEMLKTSSHAIGTRFAMDNWADPTMWRTELSRDGGARWRQPQSPGRPKPTWPSQNTRTMSASAGFSSGCTDSPIGTDLSSSLELG
ncbi:hypothetical protein AB0F52_39315 [Amycolatopsis sp. NPDC024027]|uniref:hypothetical protein n=1 Tax=Amycolatopsis sp. NPDC024027 TaxID=3154327 RepID=UPI0033C9963B